MLFLATFSELRSEAASVMRRLGELGGVELWAGCWIVELELGSYTLRDHFAFTFPTGGVIVQPLDLATCYMVLNSGTRPEARVRLERLFKPILNQVRTDLPTPFRVRWFGKGEARFGDAIEAARSAYDSNGEPTELCRLMLANGSDKGLSWHSFTVLYTELFRLQCKPIETLLEIGLGTNNADIPSSMGSDGIPGASHRAWRDYFPQATIYGADVDRRVLFEEPRIRTTWVDQLDAESFNDMWAAFHNQLFDVVIDDGLHTLQAATITLDQCIGNMRSSGVHLIEDVLTSELDGYWLLGHERGMSGAIVSVPSNFNYHDNNLFIAAGQG